MLRLLLFEVNFTRGVKYIILALLYILLQLDVMQLLAIAAILQSILNLFQGLFCLMASVKNLHVVTMLTELMEPGQFIILMGCGSNERCLISGRRDLPFFSSTSRPTPVGSYSVVQ